MRRHISGFFALVIGLLRRPSVLGALYILMWLDRSGRDSDPQLGKAAAAINLFVRNRFGNELREMAIALAAASVLFGAILGIAASLLVRARDRMARRGPRSPGDFALQTLGVLAMMHAWIVGYALVRNPALYAPSFYAVGGVGRTAHVLATDVLGQRGMFWLGIGLAVVYLAGPTAQWHRWPGRVARAFSIPTSSWGVQGGVALAVVGLAWLLGVFSSVDEGALFVTPRLARPESSAAITSPNILILAADSLRADRVRPEVTPHIFALSAQSTSFERAYVSLARTFPSWTTWLTGRYPHHHGIRGMFPRWETREKDFDALPARFARAGYATEVISDYAGDIFGRVHLGWGRTDVPAFDFRQLVRQRVVEHQLALMPVLHSTLGRAAFPVMRELNTASDAHLVANAAVQAIHASRNRPFFMTVFFSTAHFPYASPAPYYDRYTNSTYRGRFKYYKPVGLEKEVPPDERDIEQIRELYDGAIASVDDAIGEVLRALVTENLDQRTIVVITSDHGETLYEAGHGQGHGDHLFGDEGIHVPLIIFDPRCDAAHVDRSIVRDVDLAPTLYELARVPPPVDLDGRSLLGALSGRFLPPALAFGETGLWFTEDIRGVPTTMRLPYPAIAQLTEVDTLHGEDIVIQSGVEPLTIVAKHRMVRDERYKLIYAPTRKGPRYVLFDTEHDPLETVDISTEQPEVLARLKGELWNWMLDDPTMRERNGMLLPRDVEALARLDATGALRLDTVAKDAQ